MLASYDARVKNADQDRGALAKQRDAYEDKFRKANDVIGTKYGERGQLENQIQQCAEAVAHRAAFIESLAKAYPVVYVPASNEHADTAMERVFADVQDLERTAQEECRVIQVYQSSTYVHLMYCLSCRVERRKKKQNMLIKSMRCKVSKCPLLK